jgi:RNA polymerase primary sigma factor
VARDETVAAYLREIGTHPLLSAQEEVELGRKIRAYQNALSSPTIDPNLQEQLRIDAEAAKEHFISSNLRLVVSIAGQYTKSQSTLSDLIQEGNLGLMRAVEKFDPERGFRFSTYATHWIRQAISASFREEGRGIRVPGHIRDQIAEITRVRRDLEQSLAREPTYEEIGKVIGLTAERVEELTVLNQSVISLEAPVSGEGDTTLSDLYVGDDEEIGAGVDRSDLTQALEDAMAHLNESDREIIRYRFGFTDNALHSLEEASAVFGVKKEKIRQIELRAMHRLRKEEILDELRGRVKGE